MRMSSIFVLFALSLIYKGAYAWWAAAARGIEPIILSFGAAFAALGLSDKSIQDLALFTESIDKNNKIMNESKKEEEKEELDYHEKFKKDLAEKYEELTDK